MNFVARRALPNTLSSGLAHLHEQLATDAAEEVSAT